MSKAYDKEKILLGLSSDDKLIVAKAYDSCRKCVLTNNTMFLGFVSPREISIISDKLSNLCTIDSYGGYENSERRILSFSPFYNEDIVYPIDALIINTKNKKVFSHRDYLGAILSLGIKREKLGDIVIKDDSALVFCDKSISEFIILNLEKVASMYVSVSKREHLETLNIKRAYEASKKIVSSMRLDCIVSAFTGKSRSISSELIEKGMVNVNYETVKNVSLTVCPGDVISVRTFGKMEIGNNISGTRKNRLSIEIIKYS